MKSTTTKACLYLIVFALIVTGVCLALRYFVHDIDGAAPDALHFIGFVALIPMISSVGGKLAARKTAYIKRNSIFKSLVVAAFLATYLSLIPWVLSFFVAINTVFIYVDWAVVLTSIALSFVLFTVLLAVFLRE